MSVCFHWSNKSLYVEVPLIFMLVDYLCYIFLPYCLSEKRLSHGFYMPPPNRNGPTFLAKKICQIFGTLQSSLLVLEIIILMGEYKNSLIFRFEREID